MWLSSGRKFREISTLHYHPDTYCRKGAPFTYLFPSSPYVPVDRASYTLLGGLVLMLNLTMFGKGLNVRKILHDHRWYVLGMIYLELSERALYDLYILICLTF